MSVIEKVGEFLNTLTMQYELRYKWWINAVAMILSVPRCLCWSFYFQNIITFLFEKLSCAVEILIWSDAVDFLIKLLGMSYSVFTAQQACSTEMVKIVVRSAVEIVQGGSGDLSVLRTFRLLRILKLVRFMPALRYQLLIMLKTMDNVATFCSLLILFIFIFRSVLLTFLRCLPWC